MHGRVGLRQILSYQSRWKNPKEIARVGDCRSEKVPARRNESQLSSFGVANANIYAGEAIRTRFWS